MQGFVTIIGSIHSFMRTPGRMLLHQSVERSALRQKQPKTAGSIMLQVVYMQTSYKLQAGLTS